MTHSNPNADSVDLFGARPTSIISSRRLRSLSRTSLLGGGAAVVLAVLTAVVYTGLAQHVAGAFGFPLDDAWIHQTYARNLAYDAEWSFVPGVASTGSTSPLWTMILSGAFLLPGNPQLWTYAFGVFFYLGTAWMGYRLSLALFDNERVAWLTALVLLVEWHLAWAGVSGMEIPLYTFLVMWLLAVYFGQTGLPHPISWGILGGLLTLTRPEGMWLVALIGIHMLLTRRRAGLPDALWFGSAWALVILPYALYNWAVTGAIFPNTFYAKQIEYAALSEQVPLWVRLAREAWVPLIGAQVLLVPGILWIIGTTIVRRRTDSDPPRSSEVRTGTRLSTGASLLPLIWAAGLIVVYAVRLPVTYQHGRYMIPIIPVLLVYGVGGGYMLWHRLPRVPVRVWGISIIVLFIAFWGRGAVAYAEDTTVITCEMVSTAQWIDQNTTEDALIAAHDIGAIGYFSGRPLLDLAGLVSPDVIPIIRDEAALGKRIRSRGAEYLVAFPAWYPTLVRASWLEPVVQQKCSQTQKSGRDSMVIYRIVSP